MRDVGDVLSLSVTVLLRFGNSVSASPAILHFVVLRVDARALLARSAQGDNRRDSVVRGCQGRETDARLRVRWGKGGGGVDSRSASVACVCVLCARHPSVCAPSVCLSVLVHARPGGDQVIRENPRGRRKSDVLVGCARGCRSRVPRAVGSFGRRASLRKRTNAVCREQTSGDCPERDVFFAVSGAKAYASLPGESDENDEIRNNRVDWLLVERRRLATLRRPFSIL